MHFFKKKFKEMFCPGVREIKIKRQQTIGDTSRKERKNV